mmetsp:Transcript_22907/g.66204  ORF Transcript_22907/g.66204 Transcript_22907/m.66204 type:complete len:233 (+) Transcript_22907:141-839(+)
MPSLLRVSAVAKPAVQLLLGAIVRHIRRVPHQRNAGRVDVVHCAHGLGVWREQCAVLGAHIDQGVGRRGRALRVLPIVRRQRRDPPLAEHLLSGPERGRRAPAARGERRLLTKQHPGRRRTILLRAMLGLAPWPLRRWAGSPLRHLPAMRHRFRPPLRRLRSVYHQRQHAMLLHAHRHVLRRRADGGHRELRRGAGGRDGRQDEHLRPAALDLAGGRPQLLRVMTGAARLRA